MEKIYSYLFIAISGEEFCIPLPLPKAEGTCRPWGAGHRLCVTQTHGCLLTHGSNPQELGDKVTQQWEYEPGVLDHNFIPSSTLMGCVILNKLLNFSESVE